ncbi:MAG: D-tyrosyl-tRNA(Tyr) deacylase [Elusimicrobia bacterium]|nr:D-tyrosyl-tRNA(Tyr) deacylase [Elusimicrobiota bacterium]
MRALVQRVRHACVVLSDGSRREIARGLVVFLGVGKGDGPESGRKLADKIAHLRIFSNEQGKFDLSVLEVAGQALVVSQFTLYGDCRKGRRPDFTQAAPPEEAEALYLDFAQRLRQAGLSVATGEFGDKMLVELANDGPVTLSLEI